MMFFSDKKQDSIMKVLLSISGKNEVITKQNVFQKAFKENREHVCELCLAYMKEGSGIKGFENVEKLYNLAQKGKSCLITAEHKSNLDVPNLYALFYSKYREYMHIFEKIVFIAGKKLNEDNPAIRAFAEKFNRLVIVPKTTDIQSEEEKKEMFAINKAAQKWLRENKDKGYMFLIFPTGTRTRDWMPETKKGIRESFNYLKNFDYFATLSIDGNTMPVSKTGSMTDDKCVEDKVVFTFGEVMSSYDFITEKIKELGKNVSDFKQAVVDELMKMIYEGHNKPDVAY
jgi:glycerol-3-phosphate O-acyltransferase